LHKTPNCDIETCFSINIFSPTINEAVTISGILYTKPFLFDALLNLLKVVSNLERVPLLLISNTTGLLLVKLLFDIPLVEL